MLFDTVCVGWYGVYWLVRHVLFGTVCVLCKILATDPETMQHPAYNSTSVNKNIGFALRINKFGVKEAVENHVNASSLS